MLRWYLAVQRSLLTSGAVETWTHVFQFHCSSLLFMPGKGPKLNLLAKRRGQMDVVDASVLEFGAGWRKKAKCQRGFGLSPKTRKGETVLTQDFVNEAMWAIRRKAWELKLPFCNSLYPSRLQFYALYRWLSCPFFPVLWSLSSDLLPLSVLGTETRVVTAPFVVPILVSYGI